MHAVARSSLSKVCHLVLNVLKDGFLDALGIGEQLLQISMGDTVSRTGDLDEAFRDGRRFAQKVVGSGYAFKPDEADLYELSVRELHYLRCQGAEHEVCVLRSNAGLGDQVSRLEFNPGRTRQDRFSVFRCQRL